MGAARPPGLGQVPSAPPHPSIPHWSQLTALWEWQTLWAQGFAHSRADPRDPAAAVTRNATLHGQSSTVALSLVAATPQCPTFLLGAVSHLFCAAIGASVPVTPGCPVPLPAALARSRSSRPRRLCRRLRSSAPTPAGMGGGWVGGFILILCRRLCSVASSSCGVRDSQQRMKAQREAIRW